MNVGALEIPLRRDTKDDINLTEVYGYNSYKRINNFYFRRKYGVNRILGYF